MNLDNLRDSVTNLTLYDVKAAVRKVQNAVMNYTEMEAKVREATNNEPWGASSTLMQEISSGTFNYTYFNEIMPMMYKRFTEKGADEWRQIYKSLQLLEFLVKHGSERVIDDARSHLGLIKMLKSFHFIDPNGKDQGINVRNRAKELSDLLGDVERIRQERKKARASQGKYTGVSSDDRGGFGGTGNRYGGFGSETPEYGGYSGGVYGDGGGFSGGNGGGRESYGDARGYTSDTSQPVSSFQKPYDEYDEGDIQTNARATTSTTASHPPPKQPPAQVDLFSFGDDATPAKQPAAPAVPVPVDDEDEFDDFKSADDTTNTSAAFSLASLSTGKQLSGLGPASVVPTPLNSGLHVLINKSYTPPPSQFPTMASTMPPSRKPSNSTTTQAKTTAQVKTPAQADVFGSLWNTASAGVTTKKAPSGGQSMGQLAQDHAKSGIWGASRQSVDAPKPPAAAPSSTSAWNGSASDDLLG